MKKSAPYFLFILATVIGTFIWDLIKLPFNPEDAHIGDSYANNQHHSQNDTLRFLIFLLIPFFTLFFYYQFSEKKLIKNFKIIFFDNEFPQKDKNNNLKLIFWLTFFIILLEYFLIDFKSLDYHIDIFHEGLWLTPSNNSKINNEFWQSSFIYRGFFGNFYPYLLWKIFDLESIGITRLLDLTVILLNKLLLLSISYRIASMSSLNNNGKIIFYFLLSITLLIFTSYMSPVFFLRSFLLLVLIFLLLNFFASEKKNFAYIFLIGLLSSISMFWYVDIGIYINTILLILCIYLIVIKKIKLSLLLLFTSLVGWFFFYLAFSSVEFKEFLINIKNAISTIEYVHGLIFPTPFLSLDTRSTKSVIFFLITGFLIIRGMNTLEKQDSKFLLAMSILFIISIIYFKYGLSRSDSGHIRIASSFVYIPLFSLIYLYFVKFFFGEKKIFFIKPNKFLIILSLFFFSTILLNKKYENKSFKNLINASSNIKTLANYTDEKFINIDYQKFFTYYKQLSAQDECVKIFTNEVAIPYFLKKPTCSKYFLMYLATPLGIQKNIIEDLNINSPVYIIYKSDVDTYGHVGNRLKLIDNYIKDKYSFFEKFNHWEIYKRK